MLPNVITAFGLSCGLFVIFKMNMIGLGQANVKVLTIASILLLFAGVADLLDGAVARAMRTESEFGSFFDSLADAIAFTVAPSVIILKSLSMVPGTKFAFLPTTGAMVYTICGVLRLVRFSVRGPAEKESEVLPEKKYGNFTGLPTPAAAAALISANLFFVSDEFKEFFSMSDVARAWVLFWISIILGYFMISRWKFPSLRRLRVRITSFQLVFVTVVCAVFIFYGVMHHFPVIFMVVTWSYVLLAWVLSLIRLLAGSKSKTLEDFEPEPEDIELE